jgi:hypothetical protein
VLYVFIRVSFPFILISLFINWPCTIIDDFIVKYTTNISVFNLLATDFFFQILAHPVFKM